MSMVVQHNMSALNANRMLNITTKSQSKSTEKLSSGYRINRAADDAAGLAISEKMRAQVRGLNRASANAQDGISLVQTAEGALNESQSIMQRMRELSIQAANETNTDLDRENIQLEVNQLTDELNRIANTTEFNTKKLLMGNTTEASTSEMNVEGSSGVVNTATGSAVLDVLSESKSAQASSMTYTIASSETTGKASDIATVTKGEQGIQSTATLFDGKITFKAATAGESGNNYSVNIAQVTDATTTKATLTGNDLTIELAKADLDNVSTMADLEDLIGKALYNGEDGNPTPDADKITAITVQMSEGEANGADVTEIKEALANGPSATRGFNGGKDAVAGTYTFDLEDVFSEADDTITIAGQTLKAVATTATAANGEFELGTKLNQGNTIAAALLEKLKVAGMAEAGTTVSYADGKITIQEDAKDAGEFEALLKANGNAVTTAGAETNDSITITDAYGRNMTVKFETNAGDTLEAVYTKASARTDAGKDATDLITIKLASTTATKNTASLIETEINAKLNAATQQQGITVTGENITGGILGVVGQKSMAGGVQSQAGKYQLSIDNAMSAGETLSVKLGDETLTFTAVAGEADASKGEFSADGTAKDQMDSLFKAVKDQLAGSYTVETDGYGQITLTEKSASNASGVNLSDATVSAEDNVAGTFTVDVSELLKDGASVTLDGQTIEVSSKNEHVGYDNGTAMKVAETVEDQTKNLMDAIAKNSALSGKYDVSSTEDGKITFTQKVASEDGFDASTTSSTKGNFEIRLQIGANSGQSMTIEIGDNRALALGLSGDGSSATIKAEDGKVASYTTVKNVNNGSDNENIEYALDISTHEKASAATSVIDDALNEVSRQRAVLGAAQNRLEHTITNLDNTSENLTSAESAIRDTDMATEMVNYSKNNILAQAGQSMLAQANQSNQGVLSLLG